MTRINLMIMYFKKLPIIYLFLLLCLLLSYVFIVYSLVYDEFEYYIFNLCVTYVNAYIYKYHDNFVVLELFQLLYLMCIIFIYVFIYMLSQLMKEKAVEIRFVLL